MVVCYSSSRKLIRLLEESFELLEISFPIIIIWRRFQCVCEENTLEGQEDGLGLDGTEVDAGFWSSSSSQILWSIWCILLCCYDL